MPIPSQSNPQGVELRPWRTTVNLGAFVDVRQKTVSAFSRVEVDAGRAGTVVADVEGAELQKEWNVPLGHADGQLSVAAGVGFTTRRPYVAVDFRAARRPTKAAMVALKLSQGDKVDIRPALPISRHVSVEAPVTLTAERVRSTNAESGTVEEKLDHLKVHAHGAIACVKLDNLVWGTAAREGDAAGVSDGSAADAGGAKATAGKGEETKGAKKGGLFGAAKEARG